MKKRQMLLAVILMLSLAFAFTPGSFAKKKAPKLNKTKVTLQVGKSTTLKVKNTKKKVTWKSSNKSVATVSKKGVVKAKKEGKATITAKVAGKSLKCKVTVKAKTPVTPTSQTLKYVGQMPCTKKIEEDNSTRREVGYYTSEQLEAMGYKDVPGEYYYGTSYYYEDSGATVYVDLSVTFNSAKVVARTTDTKIGTYNGLTRYDIELTGSAAMPAKGYIWKYYVNTGKKEKVEVALPTDEYAVKKQNRIKEYLTNRLMVTVNYNGSTKGGDWNTYRMTNLGDTDPKFDGYVSACTFDTNGNFTYKVFDVSNLDIQENFSISDDVNFYFDETDNLYY